MVMHALEHAWGGELFVPKIPSYRIMDVAEAIGPDCEKPIVGIRPGEKVHEEMITASDSFYTYDLGKYYTILPATHKWKIEDYIKKFGAKKVPMGFSYNSGDNKEWETVESLRDFNKRTCRSRIFCIMKAIPYGRQHIEQDDIDAVVSTLRADFLTQGPKVLEFEEKFAAYLGSKYAVAVNNATSGLHLAVLALNLKPGDRVITTPITFAASGNCVRYAEGEVWFADIDSDTYLLSLEKTRQLIESKPSGFFKGIIPVDFAGLPVDMENFRSLANQHDLWIIEDACHAPGGYFKDTNGQKQMCGNGFYADMGIFSFHPVKHIACGEGGMVTTNSEALYNKLSSLRTHGITKENMAENHGGWFYEMQELGYNYRLTDIQSALGYNATRKE